MQDGDSFTVDSGKTIELKGDSSNPTQVSRGGSGYYAFTVSSGTIEARHFEFDYVNSTGVYLSSPTITNMDNGSFGNVEAGGSIPVKGMVTLVDLGAKTCIPCKMMAPILKKLKKAYKDKAAIIFIDVNKNRKMSKQFRIRAIPTQIFFDEKGKEVYRHEGFMSRKAIEKQLKKMGVD